MSRLRERWRIPVTIYLYDSCEDGSESSKAMMLDRLEERTNKLEDHIEEYFEHEPTEDWGYDERSAQFHALEDDED